MAETKQEKFPVNKPTTESANFTPILTLIKTTKDRIIKTVNTEIIDLYWQIGKEVSEKAENGGWGKSVVAELSKQITANFGSIRGFSPQNIWRMKQFYETYKDSQILSTLLRELSWSNNLLVMSRAKKEQFLDSYVLDFLNLPERHNESAIEKAIIANMKNFLLEFGKDFSFISEQCRVQVGNSDFFNENPSVGIILCADKDDEVVKYALQRNLSPVLVAEYTAKLPDKKLLQNKLRELFLAEKAPGRRGRRK